MAKIIINKSQITKLITLLNLSHVPPEQESITHSFDNQGNELLIANSYLAIVAICHQTSPLGERRLEGFINGVRKVGWDYLKEKFLVRALQEPKWSSPDYWMVMKPIDLSELYEDGALGKTLNRVNERTYLLNDLGRKLKELGVSVKDAFHSKQGIIGGDSGFLSLLRSFEAYKDPTMKKSLFFLSIMNKELGWVIQDMENLLSPVDYHELRGHIRIGTITIQDEVIASKVQQGLVLTEGEDVEIRSVVQEANNRLSDQTGLSSSIIHYLFWNVFRNCCPRESGNTHCSNCGDGCGLPIQYKSMNTYQNKCLFAEFCISANKSSKTIDPPYIGHYY
jgi:hypothetical protein